MRQLNVLFFGDVQGVGFRKIAQQIAMHLGLTGTVANLLDGSVEANIQGNIQTIFLFLERIEKSFNLSKVEIVFKSTLEVYETFSVKR